MYELGFRRRKARSNLKHLWPSWIRGRSSGSRFGTRTGVARGRSFWRVWSWVVLALMLLGAYLVVFRFGSGDAAQRVVDALRVFPHFPGYDEEKSWPYNLGRQLGALALVLATIGVIAALLFDRLTELRAGFRRGHAVVCGLGETGLRSVRAFRARGLPTTCLELNARGDAIETARDLGALVLTRDATQTAALHSVRAERARYVVCACGDDATNATVASAVVALAHQRLTHRAPSIHVHIDHASLARLLRAPLSSVGAASLHFFNTANVWARALIDDPEAPLLESDTRPPTIVVLGGTSLGQAVVVEAARRWHDHARARGIDERAAIVLADHDAEGIIGAIGTRFPAIPRVCTLRPLPIAVSGPLDLGVLRDACGAATAVYACLDNNSANLALVLEIEDLLAPETPVFFPAGEAAATLGPLISRGGVRAVELPEDDRALELIHDVTDTIAHSAHEAYLQERRRQDDFGVRRADRPWDELDEESREASRAHADAIVGQLRALWYFVEPIYDWDETTPLPISDSAVEAMAQLEHVRWCGERKASGWRLAPVRDDVSKRHDLLVPWEELPETARELDRAMVRKRPEILIEAGFRLDHDPARERVARRLHARYQERRPAAPLAVDWDALPEHARQSNLLAAEHIAVKLAHIGCRALPKAVGLVSPTTFSEDEVEELAQLEHERWVAERVAAGWRLGPRDDAAKTHPSLRPWDQLTGPEGQAEREEDRRQVREIPEVLASVGYIVVREVPA